MEWARRFFDYTGNKKGGPPQETPGTEDIREFLTHLAVHKKVSASTQNQAFNALLFLFRNVLKIEMGDMSSTIRAKRGPKLPVVLTVEEVRQLFSRMEGKHLLIAQVLYGAGLRLMELARLRVKDIDFGSGLIFIRSSKGDKDRSTILPGAVREPLQQHLTEVKALHDQDLAKGFGEVYLPDALGRKYPNAAKNWAWQYVFPSSKLSVDPRSGIVRRHHVDETSIQKVPPASSGGDKLFCLWPRGDPTDASRAFHSGPRAPNQAVTPFFQNSKMIRKTQFCKNLFPSRPYPLKSALICVPLHFNDRFYNARFGLEPGFEPGDHLIHFGPVGDENFSAGLAVPDGFDDMFEIPAGGVAAAHDGQLVAVKVGIRERDIFFHKPHKDQGAAVGHQVEERNSWTGGFPSRREPSAGTLC